MVKHTYSSAFKEAKEALQSKTEATIIFEDLLNIPLEEILKNGEMVLDSDKYKLLEGIIEKRKEGYPLQYILGKWEFYGHEFLVGEGVLIPRQDTELLVERILRCVWGEEYPYVLDLCSGTGCVAISVKKNRHDSFAFAVEKYDEAFYYLEKNNEKHDKCVRTFQKDIFDEEFISSLPSFHVVAANPPYLTAEDMKSLQKEVSYEPESALLAEDNGLYFYKKIAECYKGKIKSGGHLVFEVGHTQEKAVCDILIKQGYRDVEVFKDLCGVSRVVSACV